MSRADDIEIVIRCFLCRGPCEVSSPTDDRSTCGRWCPPRSHVHFRCPRCSPPWQLFAMEVRIGIDGPPRGVEVES